jgi:hypothetical protein
LRTRILAAIRVRADSYNGIEVLTAMLISFFKNVAVFAEIFICNRGLVVAEGAVPLKGHRVRISDPADFLGCDHCGGFCGDFCSTRHNRGHHETA